MKIAIHHKEGTFSDRWVAYCKEKKIPYKVVDAYASDIVEQVQGCDAFMWHHHQSDSQDVLFAKQLLFSLQQAGMVVFPDFNTGWHFDDKVGQKYLFEVLGLPLVPSYVFYSKKKAMDWAKTTSYPKVFKLRGGAGSSNVRLVKNARIARKLIRQAFGKGFRPVNRLEILVDALKRKRWIPALKSFVGLMCPWLTRERFMPRHKGYAYFQDFVPNAKFDIRINVVGDRANGMIRYVRKGDFRASGSGNACCMQDEINPQWIEKAFDFANKLNAQSGAFDFVLDPRGELLLVEVSYGFGFASNDGYWRKSLTLHKEKCDVANWMVDVVIETLNKKTSKNGIQDFE